MIDGLVSIIMPSWNTGRFIEETIDSVIAQTYPNWELLIVDDCSTDNTDELVAKYKDDRIKYFKNEKNSGAAFARNRAMREAQGEWIAFLDSDDLWTPEKLEHQINFMKKNGYSLSFTEYEKIDEESKPLNIYVSGPDKVNKHKMYNYDYIGQLTMMYSVKEFGLIQIKDIKKNNDYAIRLQLYKKPGTCAYLLKENLAKYRVRKVSISHDKFRRKFKSHYDLFHMCDEKTAVVAMWYACWNMFYGILKKKNYEKSIGRVEMKPVCVVGHFGHGKNMLNGQTIKTKIITKGLINQLGESEVETIDTHGGAKTLPRCFFQMGKAFKECENIIMLPAHNGVRIFTPIMLFWKALFHKKLHYVVIGGWLPDLLKSKPRLAKQLKKFDGIYIETSTMKKALETQGFHNIVILPNCKDLRFLKESELVYNTEEPYRLCTFSRVMKEKGIEDAIEAVRQVNEDNKRTIFTLDIYGQVGSEQTEWFEELKSRFPDCVRYGGLVPFDQSVEVLKNYFALLFPTRFYTEGIPGTIIDAYAAGVPVISAKWESFSDVVDDGVVGIGYDFDNDDGLLKVLNYIQANPSIMNEKKKNCLIMANKYRTNNVLKDFVSLM